MTSIPPAAKGIGWAVGVATAIITAAISVRGCQERASARPWEAAQQVVETHNDSVSAHPKILETISDHEIRLRSLERRDEVSERMLKWLEKHEQ